VALQEPPTTIVTLPSVQPVGRTSHFHWQAISLASAALLGGVLVAGGFFWVAGSVLNGRLCRSLNGPSNRFARAAPRHRSGVCLARIGSRPVELVCGRRFDNSGGAGCKGESLRQPIAVILRLTRELSGQSGQAARPITYVIVCRDKRCRDNSTATIVTCENHFTCGCFPRQPRAK